MSTDPAFFILLLFLLFYRMAQLEGFYHYNALPMVPQEMSEEEAFYNVPKDKCRWWYHEVDDCLFKWSNKDRRNYRMYHTRMHSCRRSWVSPYGMWTTISGKHRWIFLSTIMTYCCALQQTLLCYALLT